MLILQFKYVIYLTSDTLAVRCMFQQIRITVWSVAKT